MKEISEKIGEQMDLFTIVDPKFKTSTLMCMLLLPVVPEKNSAYSLALSLLTESCRKYPDNISLSVKLDHMYGASLGSSISINGSVMQLMVTGSTIADRYAPDGEKLLSELTELICDCILDPNVRDGAFDTGEFRIMQKELYDTIESEINNKRSYALLRARETIFREEPDSYPVYGVREDVDQLTPENTYAAYREILRRAVIRVYYAGPELPEGLGEQLKSAFSGLERCPEPLQFQAPSPVKPEVSSVTEPMDVTQSKLVMAFKGPETSREAVRLFNAVFGATPFSLLFMNVREKESLCYYCASRVLVGKDTLVVDSGVELANAERTREAVLEQLEALRHGEFPDELLDNAKNSIINALHSIGDTPSSRIFEHYERFYTGDDADVETLVQRYLALTREEIIEVAQGLTLDTVYLMQQGGAV